MGAITSKFPLLQSHAELVPGQHLLTRKVEIQAEILTSWRYVAIIIARRKTHFFWPLIHPAPIQVCQSPRSLSVHVAQHDWTYGWISPER